MDIDNLSKTEPVILTIVLLGADITDVYSPERITALCGKLGLVKGSALDVQNE